LDSLLGVAIPTPERCFITGDVIGDGGGQVVFFGIFSLFLEGLIRYRLSVYIKVVIIMQGGSLENRTIL
jgi:hypothetical protein